MSIGLERLAERLFLLFGAGYFVQPGLLSPRAAPLIASVTDNPNPQDRAELIKDALFIGRKLAAIKLYQQQTGLDLATAKEAIEKLETELRLSSPERFSPPKASGCFSIVVAIGLIGAAWWKTLA